MHYDTSGDEQYRSTFFFEFDKDGYLIQEKVRYVDDDPGYWTYDKAQNQLVCMWEGEESRFLPFRAKWSMNESDCEIPIILLENLNAAVPARNDYLYAKKCPIVLDSSWQIIEGSTDDFIYKIEQRNEAYHEYKSYAFQYDDRGNLTQIEYQEEFYNSKWDENLQEYVFDFSTLHRYASKTTYTYDSQNRITRKCTTSESSWGEEGYCSLDISYNEQGDVAEIVENQAGVQNIISYSYEYDSHGNWTSRTIDDGDGITKSTRVIEYY